MDFKIDIDEGNRDHVQKHGVSIEDVASVLNNGNDATVVSPDPFDGEERFQAIGKNADGRGVFVVFMFNVIEGETCLRPISARYISKKKTK